MEVTADHMDHADHPGPLVRTVRSPKQCISKLTGLGHIRRPPLTCRWLTAALLEKHRSPWRVSWAALSGQRLIKQLSYLDKVPYLLYVSPHSWLDVLIRAAVDTTSQRPVTAGRPLNNRSRLSNQPKRMAVSQRTSLGRRVRDLADSYAQRLGGWPALSDGQAAAVRRCAELFAIAEQSRAAALQNGCADPVGLARLEGIAIRAERRLGLPKETRGPITPTLADVMSAIAAEEAAS
jgi:hypothetical protein